MTDQTCPLCKTNASVAERDQRKASHVLCEGICHGEYVLPNITRKQMGNDPARLERMSKLVAAGVKDGMIRVFGWRNGNLAPRIDDREAWLPVVAVADLATVS